MFQNITSSCERLNSSGDIMFNSSPSVLVITILLVSIWIVLINAFVFICLLMSKNALKNFVHFQMLSFSLTDMFVGLSAIPMTLTYSITSAFPYFGLCAGIFYGYCISQTANLFHAFGICLHRVVIIKRRIGQSERNPENMLRTMLIQVAIIWVVSVSLVSIPFGLYSRFGERLSECSLNSLFSDKYIQFLAFMNSIFFFPQIGMNILYIYLFRFLFTTWKNMKINRKPRGHTENKTGEDRKCHINLSPAKKNTLKEVKIRETADSPINKIFVDANSVGSNTNGKVNENVGTSLGLFRSDLSFCRCSSFLCIEYEETHSEEADFEPSKSNTEDLFQNSGCTCHTGLRLGELENKTNHETVETRFSTCCDENCRTNDISTSLLVHKAKKPFSALNRKATKRKCHGKFGYHAQKRVLITIGMILFTINIFMTPLNSLVIIELINKELISRETKFILLAMSLMNSALNPIIYALRIKPFRAAVARHWNRCVVQICLCK